MLGRTDPNLVVETRGLAKSFGQAAVVKSVDLAVPRHSVFGFLGPNGAGKTTTLRMLVGLLEPTGGGGHVLGHPIGEHELELRRRVGYLPQNPTFYPDLTARETLEFASRFFYRSGSAVARRIEEVLDAMSLGDRADRPVGVFSGGERQRLGIALAQLHRPELLILDEPAAGLDPIGRKDVLELLDALRTETTVLYSTHILDDVERVSDTAAILADGTVIAQAPIERLLAGSGAVSYRLVLTAPGDDVSDELRRQPWVLSVDRSDFNEATVLTVTVADEREADRRLLRLVLAAPEVVVHEFARQRFELEDVFFDLVGQGAR